MRFSALKKSWHRLPLPHIGFASKLYIAGLIATTLIFSSLSLLWLYFYERTEQLHQINVETKTVHLNLIEVQAQAYAFYSSNNDIHLQIHQHALQELSSHMGRLTKYIQYLNTIGLGDREEVSALKQRTSAMQQDVAVYKKHFYARLLEYQASVSDLNKLQQAVLQTWANFELLLPQTNRLQLLQAWFLLRQNEQQHQWLLDKNTGESSESWQAVLQQMDHVSKLLQDIKSRSKRVALQAALQQHRERYQAMVVLKNTYASNQTFANIESELSSIGLDAYDIEDIIASIIAQVQSQLMLFALIMLSFFIVLAVFINRLLAKILTRPLVSLANKARDVGEGNLNVKIEVFSHDEIGALGKAFNSMVDNIRDSRQALITSEQYEAKQIMASMGEGLLVLDHCASVIKVNPALSSLLMYSEQELIGMALDVFLDDHDVQAFFQHDNATTSPLKRKDGSVLPAMISGSPMLDENNHYIGAVLVVHDMRQYLAMQADKEQAERSLEAEHHQRLESLGLMAGGIAHDFNNLLTPIICNSELLLKTMSDNNKAHHYIHQTLDAAMHASRLSKQMLAYSGSGRLASERITLQGFIHDMQGVLQSSVASTTRLQFDVDSPLPFLDADVTELEQMLLNLVMNASDALAEQAGDVIISTTIRPINQSYLNMRHTYSKPETATGEYVSFMVQDSGCGMAEDVQRKLFDPFFTTKLTGRGLGMSAVLGIVYSHHGVLHVDSKLGEGTVFTVSFPISKQQDPRQDEQSKLSTADARSEFQGHLLIVDDEEAVVDVLEGLLESLGCTTIHAYDGAQAVAAYQQHQHEIDAVILDMTMPVMSGAVCFKKLLAFDPDIKVVLSSGFAQTDLEGKLSTQDLAAYLQKPYNMQDLMDMLNVVLVR